MCRGNYKNVLTQVDESKVMPLTSQSFQEERGILQTPWEPARPFSLMLTWLLWLEAAAIVAEQRETRADSRLWTGSGRAGRRCAAVQDSPDPAGSAGSEDRRRPGSDSCPARPDRGSSPRNLPPPSPGSRSAEGQRGGEGEREFEARLSNSCNLRWSVRKERRMEEETRHLKVQTSLFIQSDDL